MKKKLLGVLVCVFSLLFLTGCGNKTAIDTETFTKICEENGFESTSVLEQYSDYEQIKEATVAKNADGLQIEFYVIDNEDNAQSMYEHNKSKFENSKGSVSSNSNVNMGNYQSYSQKSDGRYMSVVRIGNTLIYIDVEDTYKDLMKDLVKQLGY